VLDGVPLAQTMPVFRGRLTEEQVLGVLAYIKSTWPEDVRQWQREGSEQYEAQVRENP
jgi:mono/diheme cytochrome c family protein